VNFPRLFLSCSRPNSKFLVDFCEFGDSFLLIIFQLGRCCLAFHRHAVTHPRKESTTLSDSCNAR